MLSVCVYQVSLHSWSVFFLLEQALLESIQTTSVVSLGHLESVWVEVSWFECKIQTAEKVIGMLGMCVLLPLHGCSGSFAVYFGLANKSETFAAPCRSSVYPWDDYFSLKACRVLQDTYFLQLQLGGIAFSTNF